MNARTIRDFTYANEIRPIVDAWAKETNHREKPGIDGARLFQRGYGFWTAPTMLQVTQAGSNVHLESWVRVGLLARLMALFLIPAEMGVESGGMKGAAPRSIGRKTVNALLVNLGQPPVG